MKSAYGWPDVRGDNSSVSSASFETAFFRASRFVSDLETGQLSYDAPHESTELSRGFMIYVSGPTIPHGRLRTADASVGGEESIHFTSNPLGVDPAPPLSLRLNLGLGVMRLS